MVDIIKHLSSQVPIVNPDGTPTSYFARLIEAISDAKIAASVVEALGGDPGSNQVVTWDDSAGALDFKTLSDVLDFIGSAAHGDVLYRDSASWARLPAGTDGDVLTTHGASADPTWESPPSNALPSAQFEHGTAVNVAGGSSVASAWYGRYLNNEIYDDIGLALRASTITVTIASPGVVTWTGHSLVAGSPIVFSTTGALPTGITAGTIYYVIATGLTANTFQFAATANAVTGINTSGSQSGVHTCTSSSIELPAGTYEVDAEGSFYQSNMARIRLRDVTNNVNLGTSVGFYGSSANAGNAHPRILSRFTLSGTAVVHLQYYVIAATATQGQGLAANMVDPEVHARLKITQLS